VFAAPGEQSTSYGGEALRFSQHSPMWHCTTPFRRTCNSCNCTSDSRQPCAECSVLSVEARVPVPAAAESVLGGERTSCCCCLAVQRHSKRLGVGRPRWWVEGHRVSLNSIPP
jgi:hypothetical protein